MRLVAAERAAEATLGSPRRTRAIVLVLGAIAALGPFTMDLYLPAFPSVMHELHTTEGAVRLTLTATAVGMGFGQLVVGPLSDMFGRKVLLIVATTLHVASSIGIALAPTVDLVSAMRFGEGIGAAASAVVTVAMIRDIFEGYPLVRMLARIALLSGLAPVVAPIVGSQLLQVIDWRGIFWMLAAYGSAVVLLAVLLIPETLPRLQRGRVGVGAGFSRFVAVLSDRVFVGAALVGGFVFSELVTYLSSSPFLFQVSEGLNAQQFGMLFGAIAVALWLSTQAAARLMRWFEPGRLVAVGLSILFMTGAVMIVLAVIGAGFFPLAAVCLVLVSTCGFCFPCLQVIALQNHKNQAGTAIAVTGFTNSVVGGSISMLPSAFGAITFNSLGIVVVGAISLALLALVGLVLPSPTITGAMDT
ncbi:multidrug effflux MFS transporter [Diaminobutyricibacter tongyongensis]|uniref:Multidrug effflux MFS transporter n=1 Tax=Leifsonia tongyongensis TaxID=1268043 RepID=A0A6L9XU57_9MICO|nr:multidrug effflux MFS transporter [Diaminobutyricibacter tongyongensis]